MMSPLVSPPVDFDFYLESHALSSSAYQSQLCATHKIQFVSDDIHSQCIVRHLARSWVRKFTSRTDFTKFIRSKVTNTSFIVWLYIVTTTIQVLNLKKCLLLKPNTIIFYRVENCLLKFIFCFIDNCLLSEYIIFKIPSQKFESII